MSETSVDPVDRPSWDTPASYRRVGAFMAHDGSGRVMVDWAYLGGERFHFAEAIERAILASDPRVQALVDAAERALPYLDHAPYENAMTVHRAITTALAALQEETGRGEDGDGRTTM